MNILCVIPSRLNSTRLSRKPLLPIQGKPMVQWVYEQACRCPDFTEVVVATDALEIAEVIQDIGGKVMLTDPKIANGSERVAAVARKYPDMQVIVNLQGDEPFIQPHMLSALVAPYLAGESPEMITLASPLDLALHQDAGIVKVIVNLKQEALYFSRAPIPYQRTTYQAPVYHHKGVYAFQRAFLLRYASLAPTPLELAESLEQLRVLEHGYKIRVCLVNEPTLEINTPAEYEAAQTFAVV